MPVTRAHPSVAEFLHSPSPGSPSPKASPSASTIGLYTSNNDLGSPDCRMIDRRVPMRISRWLGTGTVAVV